MTKQLRWSTLFWLNDQQTDSGIAMGRRSNTNERRQQIVDALLRLMGTVGYEGASVQAIGREAGLTPGLIHYHFKSKLEILLEAVKQVEATAEQRYRDAVSGDEPAPVQLRALVHAWLGLGKGASERIAGAWVVIGAEASRQPEVREIYQALIARQLDLLARLLCDAGLRRDVDEKATAAGILATMVGAFQLSVAAPDAMPKGYAETQALQQIDAVLVSVAEVP